NRGADRINSRIRNWILAELYVWNFRQLQVDCARNALLVSDEERCAHVVGPTHPAEFTLFASPGKNCELAHADTTATFLFGVKLRPWPAPTRHCLVDVVALQRTMLCLRSR